ncbi:MAG: hypothetical protein K940chlam7_02134 [Chlamydiae bacterium]|nr:hypothetical protein [Chlamydiota bacterium]
MVSNKFGSTGTCHRFVIHRLVDGILGNETIGHVHDANPSSTMCKKRMNY